MNPKAAAQKYNQIFNKLSRSVSAFAYNLGFGQKKNAQIATSTIRNHMEPATLLELGAKATRQTSKVHSQVGGVAMVVRVSASAMCIQPRAGAPLLRRLREGNAVAHTRNELSHTNLPLIE
ncbi:MAG: hypothetical protein WEK74_11890 [Hydrogenophaga sp.]